MGLGAHLSQPIALLIQFINFAILAGALIYFLRKPFKGYLKKRHDSVKERLDEADKLLKEAEELKKVYERRLSSVEGEIAAFRDSAMAEMEKERTKVLKEAESLAARIREQARLAYEQEMKEALARVRAEVSERTIKAAEDAVRQQFKMEDHDKLVEEFIQNVRSAN